MYEATKVLASMVVLKYSLVPILILQAFLPVRCNETIDCGETSHA